MSKMLWLPIALGIFLLSVVIYQRVRNKIFERKLFGKGREKRVAGWLDANLRYAIIVCYFLIFAAIVVLIYFVFGQDHLLDGFVLGAIILSFIIFELPRLSRPNFYVVFLPGKEDVKRYEDTPQLDITISVRQEKALLFFRVTNRGLNNYQNCTFWFSFHEGFMPLTDQNLYDGIDFAKEFKLQKQNRCALFSPDKNYLSIPAGNHMFFPIWVQIPQTLDNIKKEVLVLSTSETRWGEFAKKLELRIVQENQTH